MRDLFVEASGDYQAHNLALARRQRIEALTKLLDFRAFRASFAIQFQCLPDRIHQFVLPDRLREEVNGAGFESLYRHGYVAAAGEEDDRHTNTRLVHLPLQLQPVHTRHADIQNNASGYFARVGVQELIRRCKSLDGHTDSLNQAGKPLPDRNIVIYQKDCLARVSSLSRPGRHAIAKPT